MSILAAVATFTDDPGRTHHAHRMLEAMPGWAPDGLAVREAPGAALGFGKLVVSAQQGHGAQPLRDPEAGLVLVADVRIDNRDELGPRFGLPASATDAQIVLAGFRRLGPALVHLLVGDFAFVVWDERKRTLFAARDTFGARPLVYRLVRDRLLVASDVEQILAVDDTARVVDDVAVVDHLLYRCWSYERTYFEPIKQLAPGCQLVAVAAGAATVSRWWSPAPPGPPIRDPREGLEEFRRVFARAVADRLLSQHPIVLHLSGGFDSSVIALVAGQLGAAAPMRAVGWVHPGLPCDESPLIEATAASLPYPYEPSDGTVPDLRDFTAPALAGPGARVPRTNGTIGDLEIARRDGARVVLSGLGGDALHPQLALVKDFAARGAWRLLLRSMLAPDNSWAQRARVTRRALALLAPERLMRWRERRAPRPSFPWLAPRFWSQATADGPAAEDFSRLLGHGGSVRWYEWRRPLSVAVLRSEQRAVSAAGAECRCPFLDLRVCALVDRLPLSVWHPPRYVRRLHALAYADLLPPELRARRPKATFDTVVVHRVQHARASIEAILDVAAPKVQRYLSEAPRVLVSRLIANVPPVEGAHLGFWKDSALAWSLATVEAWLGIV
jgi:asparagine synthetase B (glutamine-hydrolysing)